MKKKNNLNIAPFKAIKMKIYLTNDYYNIHEQSMYVPNPSFSLNKNIL